jgi:hypothetical protein
MIAIIKRILRRIVTIHDRYSVIARINKEGVLIIDEFMGIFLIKKIEDENLKEKNYMTVSIMLFSLPHQRN